MAEIRDCIGKNVKISKCSITIKDDNGKTCGVVRDITSLYDLSPNKQFAYWDTLKKSGIWASGFSIKNVIIKDNTIYVFRNIKSKLFHEKYGFFDEQEKEKYEREETNYNLIKNAGIEVIECIYV